MAISVLKRRLEKVAEVQTSRDPWLDCGFRWKVYRNLHLTYGAIEGDLMTLEQFCGGGEAEIEFKKSILEVTSND